MSNRRDIQFTYNPHNKATILDCSFNVAPADTAGLGVTALQQSGRVATAFMHTTATAGSAPNGQKNPNPAAGLIVVTLQDNYNSFLGSDAAFSAPLSGSSISISTASSLTVGAAYVITAVGTSTQAQWIAVGLSPSIPAAVGVSFIASATAGAGTGTVQAPTAAGSGIDHIEVIGVPGNMNNSATGSILGQGVGMQMILACYKNGVLTAPTAGTNIQLCFYLNNSAQGV